MGKHDKHKKDKATKKKHKISAKESKKKSRTKESLKLVDSVGNKITDDDYFLKSEVISHEICFLV